MNILLNTVGVLTLGLVASGCDRTSYETKPVVLNTVSGEVACQLYTVERTYWDHAVLYPEALTRAQADAICLAEGERQKAAHKTSQGKNDGQSGNGFLGIFGGQDNES